MVQQLAQAIRRFVSTSSQIAALKAKLVSAERQRDYLMELLTAERQHSKPAQNDRRASLLGILHLFGLTSDGEPSDDELAGEVGAQIQSLLEDVAELEDALECANSAEKTSGIDALIDFRVQVVKLVGELSEASESRTKTIAAVNKLIELAARPVNSFGEARNVWRNSDAERNRLRQDRRAEIIKPTQDDSE